MKVTVMARIREGNKYPFVDPGWQGNKLKPGAVIVKDATGKKIEVKRDDVSDLFLCEQPRLDQAA